MEEIRYRFQLLPTFSLGAINLFPRWVEPVSLFPRHRRATLGQIMIPMSLVITALIMIKVKGGNWDLGRKSHKDTFPEIERFHYDWRHDRRLFRVDQSEPRLDHELISHWLIGKVAGDPPQEVNRGSGILCNHRWPWKRMRETRKRGGKKDWKEGESVVSGYVHQVE